MKNGRCNWPRGKVIGGSSVLNYMLYVRGNKKDYDGWEAQGNPGWGYRDALYYFKKSEDNQNPYLAQTPYHGTGGYLTVSEAPYHTPLVASFIDGGKQLGYKNRDINGEYQTGEWFKKIHIYGSIIHFLVVCLLVTAISIILSNTQIEFLAIGKIIYHETL